MVRLQTMAAFPYPAPRIRHPGATHCLPCFESHRIIRPPEAFGEAVMAFNRMDSAAYLAGQLSRAFSRSLQNHAAELGFSPGQWPILLELWAEDGLTQRQLIDRVGIEQATMANTLSRMERDGLVERRAHPRDRRAQLVFLTEEARLLEDKAVAAACAADDALFAGFRRFERELLLEYIRMVLANSRKD